MKNPISGLYKYQHLPLLAKFILDSHIYDFAVEQLHYARQYNAPLLKFLNHLPDEHLLELSSTSLKELFTCLINNKGGDYIASATKKWLTNQLEMVGKHDISAEDITLVFHIRGKSLINYAFKFYDHEIQIQELLAEINDFLLASTTKSLDTYIDILKEQIHEEEEFRSKLSDALPGFIYCYDVKYKVQTFTNDKLKDILGFTSVEMKSRSDNFYQPITHPEDWEKTFDCRQKYSEGDGEICAFECRVKDTYGIYKWLRYYETILRMDPNDGVREIIGVAFDISVEKEIAEALAMRKEELLEAQSIAHIGSFEWHISGQNSTTNTPEIYKIFEMEKMEKFEEFVNHVHHDDIEKVQDAINLSFKTGHYDCVYRYWRNGKKKIIWSKGVVTIDEGKPVKMVGTVQDVTTIKRIEEELKQKTIELEKSNESLQQFAAVASHDLKEPLRKISVYGSKVLAAEKDKLTELSQTALSKIFDSTGRMQRMIDDILQFSFLDGNQLKQQTNLEELLSEVKELLSETILNKKAEIVTDGLPDALVIAPQIRQLFQNLIANALKFSKVDDVPRITITHTYYIDSPAASVVTTRLEICIADNGIGFDDRDSEKIFGLFYRLHNKAQFEGTGLGLSICKKIVDQHSGTIEAKSKIGEGSKFIIQLPQ
ncbi:PAS domain-containing sensor histidine kinase [Segetibacter koreensis]|uniref:PAS domain-containing sensor histidine kinase n=1 Tax=Segetibacter koreensis TaxID=398037 RepID=UPI000365AE10|nr:PAS domain-containing sensor histidine kinase [Segetibacter koreensis]